MPVDRRSMIAGVFASALIPNAAYTGPLHARTRVMVVASMHKRLATSVYFTYDDLYAAVDRFRPDWVGVEIRPEDMTSSDDYLSKNFPAEMIHLARQYGSRAFGFDWLGDDLAGRAIPPDWWKVQSPIKKLERESADAPPPSDRLHKRLAAKVDALSERQDQILRQATVTDLGDGRYDRVSADYYATLRALTAGTRFAALPAFYARRDREIAKNIVKAIIAHPGARIAIVTGGDHHGPVVRAIARDVASAVIAPVL